jgi:hypothetical protein
VDPVELPDPVPEPLARQRVLAEQLGPEDALDQVVEHHRGAGPGEEGDSLDARVGADPQHAALAGGRAAGQPVAPAERRVCGGHGHPEGLDVGDLHGCFLIGAGRGAPGKGMGVAGNGVRARKRDG